MIGCSSRIMIGCSCCLLIGCSSWFLIGCSNWFPIGWSFANDWIRPMSYVFDVSTLLVFVPDHSSNIKLNLSFILVFHIFPLFPLADVPDPPRFLNVEGIYHDSVMLTWKPPMNDGGGFITQYVVEKKEEGMTSWIRTGTTRSDCLLPFIHLSLFLFLICKKDVTSFDHFEIIRILEKPVVNARLNVPILKFISMFTFLQVRIHDRRVAVAKSRVSIPRHGREPVRSQRALRANRGDQDGHGSRRSEEEGAQWRGWATDLLHNICDISGPNLWKSMLNLFISSLF